MKLFLGIDFGTSGARLIAIDNDRNICWSDSTSYGAQTATQWSIALFELLGKMPIELKKQLTSIAFDGTSGTVLLCDNFGQPLADPLMYNDDRARSVLEMVRSIAPVGDATISATSGLAKLYWYTQQPYFAAGRYLLHQADWLAWLLHGQLGYSDYHNALKLGYDPVNLAYPQWLRDIPEFHLLPQVLAPGEAVGQILPAIAAQYQINPECLVCASTTDSIAAFAAAGAHQPGQAVTSLGSTLVIKLLSTKPVQNASQGVYSHRWGDLWLAGGASNTGGAVLRQFFSNAELQDLSEQIDPQNISELDYYPLLKPGERFPINDPNLLPRLEPRPDRDQDFLQGLLTGIARIEAQGYQLLQQLGADHLTQIYTTGGGAQNSTWQTIRQNLIGVPITSGASEAIVPASQQEAAYGAALLALNGGFGDRVGIVVDS
jgi:D-ribulokinase